MPASIYRVGERVWVHDVLGNFVYVQDRELKATVAASEWEPWQIVLHFPGSDPQVVSREQFDSAQEAMARAGVVHLTWLARKTLQS